MAQSQAGKWVSKVAATGGGRTYRKQRPTNFYAAVAVIVVLGLLSVVLARHDYQNRHAAAAAANVVTPTVGTTSYASLAFDVCGALEPSLQAQTETTLPITALSDGVLRLSPRTASEAGAHSTLALFTSSYKGLSVSSSFLGIPGSLQTPPVTYKNGDVCAAGTPDAGKRGQVIISSWRNFAATTATTTTDASVAHLSSSSLMTVGFLPSGSKILKPSETTIQKMLIAAQTTTTTTTTTPSSTTTTAPTTTTTTKTP